MKKLVYCLLVLFMPLLGAGQQVTIQYKLSAADFANPERGFYIPSGTRASNFVLLDTQQLKRYQASPQKLAGASYTINASLLYRAYELDVFKQKPLSDSFLQNLQHDFDAVRTAGLKIILRFAYTNQANTGSCKDAYGICPPYGDAPRQVVFTHVAQLKPLLQKNADIIAVLQQGFIGIWGENYFTDYWGCATDDGAGVIPDSSWVHRNQLLKALLDAMPANRQVQVRTPQIKQRFIYGEHALPSVAPLSMQQAFNGSDAARVGLHNDCFLASEDDYGTFYDYGNSSTKRDTANIRMRRYFEQESKYVAIGGETCDDAYSPQNDCGPLGLAEKEMAAMHYSYLNAAYNNQVNNDWDSAGCMHRIQNRLGYRLQLVKAVLPATVKKGNVLAVQLTVQNAGYAAPYNPRPVQLVLRHIATGHCTRFNFTTNIRSWFTGIIQLKQKFVLPATLAPGAYQLLLHLPDEAPALASRPAYAIRLANQQVWEPATGYNNLLHVLHVK